MANSKMFQESFDDGFRHVVTSRARRVTFPPNLNRLRENDRHQTRPPEVLSDTEEENSLSFDFISLPFEPHHAGNIAAFGRHRHVDNNPTLQPISYPDTGARSDIENTNLQHSSPHQEQMQKNPTCNAPSSSSIDKQHVYNRPKPWRYPIMAVEEERLLTFEDWPHRFPRGEDLAAANMFYGGVVYDVYGERIIDQVLCFKCGQTIRGWQANDNPVEEHKRIFMNCFSTTWKEEQ